MDVGLTHVALPAVDLDASAAFYARYARMQVVHQRDGVLWLSDKTRPAHLGVACGTREEVDRLSEEARDEERLIAGPLDYGPPVGYWAFIRDPDGHTLELSHGQDVGLTVEHARS
ncbi:MAG: VOC family protein [Deltaproteobacteria bacterium]|nr:VOC family protein [Deltaproteobacteria bacterium]